MKKLILSGISIITLFGMDISNEIESLNNKLPIKTDSFTTFEKAYYRDHSIFFIKKIDTDDSRVVDAMGRGDWSTKLLKIQLNEQYINCKNSSMKEFFDEGGRLVIKYQNSSHITILPIIVDKNVCKLFNN